MLVGAQKISGNGAIIQVESKNGKNFENLKILGETKNFNRVDVEVERRARKIFG